jgi:hypothetical protein
VPQKGDLPPAAEDLLADCTAGQFIVARFNRGTQTTAIPATGSPARLIPAGWRPREWCNSPDRAGGRRRSSDRHGRTEERLGYRNGYRSRSLNTQVGDIDASLKERGLTGVRLVVSDA